MDIPLYLDLDDTCESRFNNNNKLACHPLLSVQYREGESVLHVYVVIMCLKQCRFNFYAFKERIIWYFECV